jgi:hypothetical protein
VSLGRVLIEAGKELLAFVVEKIAGSKAAPPKVHPRHRVVARPIGERPRRLDDDDKTPHETPAAKRRGQA